MHAIMVFSKGMIIRKQSRELVPKGRLWVPYSRQYGSGRVGHDKARGAVRQTGGRVGAEVIPSRAEQPRGWRGAPSVSQSESTV